MQFDFHKFFQDYEQILRDVDAVFQRVRQQHPDEVTCVEGCSDCCHALFDLSLIEALYINHHFLQRYDGLERGTILERADRADREAYKLKHKVFKASEEGVSTAELLEQVAKMRVRCPLLNDEDKCDLYEHRPATCRVYGAPMAISGQAHTCGRTGFDPGKSYPTVHVEKIQDRLMLLSQELVQSIPTKYSRLFEVLVPVSMALLTKYDNDYLGIKEGEACGHMHSFVVGGTEEQRAADEKEIQAAGCDSCASASNCDQTHTGQCPSGMQPLEAPKRPGGA